MNIINKVGLLLITAALLGCTPTIIDYDADKLEATRINKLKDKVDPFNSPATADHVLISSNDDIFIDAFKLKPIEGPQHIKLDVWEIQATNKSEDAKCVTIRWMLQDFEFETGLPYNFLIHSHEILKVGKVRQTIWSFDDTLIAIPPSGYIDNMLVMDASQEPNGTYTCEALENDIDTIK